MVQNHRTDNLTDIGEGLNTRGGKGAFDDRLQYKEDKPHAWETQKDLIQFTTDTGSFNVSI